MNSQKETVALNPQDSIEPEEKVAVQAHLDVIEDTLISHKVEVNIPKSTLKYKPNPKLIGKEKILFMNCEDVAYYERKVANPILTIWVLRKKDELNYTAKRLFETAYKMDIQIHFMQIRKFDLTVTQDGLDQVYYHGQKITELPDAVIPRIGKIDYFSLAIVRQLQKMEVLFLNDLSSLEISRAKLKTLQTLSAVNLPIPKTMIAKFPFQYDAIRKEFQYPIILKKSFGSITKGVMLVQSEQHLMDIEDMLASKHALIFQEYIQSSHGKDIRVLVVGGKALGGMMRTAKRGFDSSFKNGGNIKPVRLSNALEWLAIDAAKQIGLDVAGVDLLIGTDSYKISEVSASPGFEGFETATGVDVAKNILEFVLVRSGVWSRKFKKQKKKGLGTGIPVMAEHISIGIPEHENKEEKKVDSKEEKVQEGKP